MQQIDLELSDVAKKLKDIEDMEILDVFQKTKIKWRIEGDENSTFPLKLILNKTNRQVLIRRIKVKGRCITEPSLQGE